MDSITSRNMSYPIRQLVDGHPRDARWELAVDVERYHPEHPEHVHLRAGELVRVESHANAGFNGIIGTLVAEDGRRVHGVSLGALATADVVAALGR